MAADLRRSSLPLFHVFLLPLFLIPDAAADLTSDRQALLAFSTSVPHTRDLNWNSSSPSSICLTWTGVTCSRHNNNARVLALRLPGIGLRGAIPENTLGRLDALEVLSLRSNHLSGSLPTDILSLPRLRHLFLQRNNFDGTLPLFSTPAINVLDLSSNHFSGEIPSALQNLTQLTALYLHNNSLTGTIPHIVMPKLRTLNLSYNNDLNGPIPSSFQKFPITSFLGMPLLCGLPTLHCSPPSAAVPSPSPSSAPLGTRPGSNKLSTGLVIVIVVGALTILMVLALIVFVSLLLCAKRRETPTPNGGKGAAAFVGAKGEKKHVVDLQLSSGAQEAARNKLVFFEGCPYTFDLEDLLRASAEVMGKGSFGTAYKAILEDGTTLVVKRLREVVVGRREFEQQMETVGGIGGHPNVVPLRGYYYSKDEKLLVYDYMTGGSLCSWLHGSNNDGGRRSLNWDSRVQILLGAARGISHIHSIGGAKFVHGNIRSSNVLLTQDGEGCVSDSSLAPLMSFLAKPPSMLVGYVAPEVIDNHKYSQKSDIYSFGVLMLEILTGKAPFKSLANDDTVDLPGWVQSVVREEWTAEVFDADLAQYPDIEEEMVQMLQAGIMCVAAVPEQRPCIEEVIRMIESIRQHGSADRSKGFIDFTTSPQDSS